MKHLLILIAFFCSLHVFSQDTDHRLKFYAIDFSPLNFYGNNGNGGIAFDVGISFKKNKNIFKLFALTGGEFSTPTFGASESEGFSEMSFMVGRELKLEPWLYLDAYIGMGYFRRTISTPVAIPGTGGGNCGFGGFCFSSPDYDYVESRESTIGFPLQGRIGFQTGKRFSLGLQFHSNINAVDSYFSLGLFLQWRLGRVTKD